MLFYGSFLPTYVSIRPMNPHTTTTTHQQLQRLPVATGGGKIQTPFIHPRYAEARERAYQLETEIESAQKQYAAQLRGIIQKLQLQFYQKYGDKLYELEDLEHAIQNIQYQGQRALQRQLTALYLKGASEDHAHGGALADPAVTKQRFQDEAKQLCEQFRKHYCPEDNYQAKRDAEAARLQRAILCGGRDGGMMVGDGGMRMLPENGEG